MNKDTSLEDIDILKLLIYILVFIVICLIMIFGFIVPNIKEYRSIQAQNRSQIASVSKVEQIYNSKNNVLDEIKQKDRTVLKAFDTKFNKIKFFFLNTKYTIFYAKSQHIRKCYFNFYFWHYFVDKVKKIL